MNESFQIHKSLPSFNNKDGEFLRSAIWFIIPLACFLLYWPARQFSFVNFDDPFFVTLNPTVRAGLTWQGIHYALTTTLGFWEPVTWLSLMLDASLSGVNPHIFHLTNIWIHCINCMLIFSIGFKLSRSVWSTALTTLLFAWHPLNVESVAWISERKGLLAALFGLLSCRYYLNYVQTRSGADYGRVCIFFILSLASKTTLLMYPAILLIADWWPLGRFCLEKHDSDFDDQEMRNRRMIIILQEKVPLFVIAGFFLLITLWTESEIGALKSTIEIPLTLRLQNALYSLGWYLFSTIIPHDLTFYYPYPKNIAVYITLFLTATLGSVAIFIFRQRRKMPQLVTCFSIWLLGILPVLGLFQIGFHARADRYMYLPIIPLIALIIWLINISWRGGLVRQIFIFLLLFGIVGLEFRTASDALGSWASSKSLYDHALKQDPQNLAAKFNFSQYLIEEKKYQQAIDLLDQIVKSDPQPSAALHNKAFALTAIGKDGEAVRTYQMALESDPKSVQTLLLLARLHAESKDPAVHSPRLALQCAKRAVILNPDTRATWQMLINCYAINGQPRQAQSMLGCAAERLGLNAGLQSRIKTSSPNDELR